MKQKLIDILSKFGYPVILQGSMNADEPYPNSFITFFVNNKTKGTHLDNNAVNYIWDFSVIFYSNDPTLVNSKPTEIQKALEEQGFNLYDESDVLSDEKTHTGWAQDYYYVETK